MQMSRRLQMTALTILGRMRAPVKTRTYEMDFDMGGRVIKLVSWYDESIQGDSPDGIQMLENLNRLKEKHNFEVDYVIVDYQEYLDKVTASLIAGEPLGISSGCLVRG